jgi:SAM-dependent methyltransferase
VLTQDEIHKIAAVESGHWWYRGMRELFFAHLAPYLTALRRRTTNGSARALKILDVGCGTGGNLIELATLGDAHGIDADPLCVEYCLRRGLDVRLGTMERIEEAAGSLDLVTTVDVVCQAEGTQTEQIFRGIARVLAPGGLFALREPAMPVAAGAHDRAVGIRHRFTTREIRDMLAATGFEPLRVTYINSLLFGPIVLQRRIGRLLAPAAVESDVKPASAPVNAVLLGMLRLEAQLLRAIDMPFGVTVFAVARKKNN